MTTKTFFNRVIPAILWSIIGAIVLGIYIVAELGY